jgi:hypothetical protein
MLRLLSTLLICTMACGLSGNLHAESAQNAPDREIISILKQNPLVADVDRANPDDVWNLVSKLNVLVTNQRDSGGSRSGSTPTPAESAQIAANPALHLAFQSDPAGALALLRETNDELGRAHLQDRQAFPRRLALVVGSSGDAVWGRLATARNDARLIAETLRQQGFSLAEGGAVIDPDKPHLLQAIKRFARSIGPDTAALFYYAGHGAQSNARNFIVPAGAPIPRTGDDYDRYLVAMDDAVLKRLQEANGRLNVIVLDACRDHPAPLAPHGAAPPPRVVQGLAPMNAPAPMGGTIIIFSTAPNAIARDSVDGSPDSPFATAFAEAINEGGLEIRDVFDRTQTAVDAVTNHQQEPWISYSAAAKFYFSTNRPPGDTGPADQISTRFASCPKPGTTITLRETGRTITGTYGPPDSADPAICRLSTSAGEVRGLLYNLYDTRLLLDQGPMRTALKELLSGDKAKVTFQVELKTTFPFTRYLESWTRVGQETLTIDHHYVRTVVYERDTQGGSLPGYPGMNPSGIGIRARWKIWFNPDIGVVAMRQLPVVTEDPGAVRGKSPDDSPMISVLPF